MSKIVNARITDTLLGYEDHGILTCILYLQGGGWEAGFGGYGLSPGSPDSVFSGGPDSCKGFQAAAKIIKTLDVKKWEDLKGIFIRTEITDSGRVLRIGHLLEDQWFSLEEFFSGERLNENT